MYIDSSMLPGCFSAVNLNNHFIAANDNRIKLFGFKRLEQLVGKHYSELPCKAALQANVHDQQNKQVYQTGKNLKFLDYTCYVDDTWKLFIGEKRVLLDANNNIMGVCGHSIDITNSRLIDLAPFLMETQQGKAVFRKKQFSYIISDENDDSDLSQRQQECLFFLLKGKTAKEIGKLLNLSSRTVESYIDHIKFKFNVNSKGELMDYAIHQGYGNILPESLIKI